MFCGNCGREIINNTSFCPYCGAEQTAVVIPGASIPVSAPISEPDVLSTPLDENTASVEPAAPEVHSEPIEQSITSMGITAAESVGQPGINGLPTPNAIPTSNIGMPETAVYTSAPVRPVQSNVFQAEIAIGNEEKRKDKYKYSLKHIVMCLAAAAVMAVAAGVFAGLYFSLALT